MPRDAASGMDGTLPVLDRQRLLDAAGDDEEIAAELVGTFAEEAKRLWGCILEGRAGGDLVAVAEAAHSLKGSARMLGFVRLAEAAARLQIVAAAGEDVGAACAAVEAVIGDAAAVRQS